MDRFLALVMVALGGMMARAGCLSISCAATCTGGSGSKVA